MSDQPTAPTSAPIAPDAPADASPLVSKPFVTAKPYDDEMLEAYEEVEKAEAAPEAPAEPEVKPKEQTDPVKKDEPDPEKLKTDKGAEGIEEMAVKRAINGKEVEFKVKDAIQAFVKQEEFNRNMDRRITQVSQREKRWEAEQGQLKDRVGKVIEVAQGGDFVTAIRALAKLAAGNSGADVVEFEKKYFDQLDKVRDVYTKLTPEQREAYFAKRSAEEHKARAKSLEDEKSASAEISQLQSRVNALQQQYGVQETEFWQNYKALESSQVGDGKKYKTPNDIQPEDVINYSLLVRHEEKVLQAGQKLGIDDEAILDEVSRITITRPDLTVEDVVRIIEGSGIATKAPPSAVENLNRKAGTNSRFNQASSTKKANGKIDGLDTEDVEFLYRKQPKAYARPVR